MIEEKVNPLQLLIEEFESEETRVRVNAIRRLPIIAAVLGESSQAKGQILGFLENILNSDEDDEVLFGMGESLLNLARYFKLKMIYILEKLVCVEETIVRKKAVDCYIVLVKYLKKSEIHEVLIPNIKKLAESSKFITKISAINIMTEIYPACSEEDKKIIRNKLNNLFGEDSLMVRRVLASKLGTLCNYMSKSIVLTELINSFKTLTNDDSDNVRILTIKSLIDLAKNLNDEENKTHMIPIIINLTSDKSWRVKFSLANNFANIAKAVGKEVTDSLVSIFSSLLRDPESEVRIAAIKALTKFIILLKIDRLKSILAYLQTLSKDNVAMVRTCVAETLQVVLTMKLPEIKINSKDSLGGRIHSILIGLLVDQDLEVKMEALIILKKWGNFVKVKDLEDIISKLINSFEDIKNWRLKHSIIDSLLQLACKYKDQNLFNKYFKKIFILGIKDKTNAVRELTIQYILKLSAFLDDNYLLTYITVEMLQIIDDNNSNSYHIRITSIYGINKIHESMKKETSINQLIKSQLIPLTEDRVVNIRQVSVKVLKDISKRSKNSEIKELIKNRMKEIAAKDPDLEVQYLAKK